LSLGLVQSKFDRYQYRMIRTHVLFSRVSRTILNRHCIIQGSGVNQRTLLTLFPLIFYNLIPIIGVLFWDWTLFTVLLLYWLESGVIGVFNLIRIGMAQAPISEGFKINGQHPAGQYGKWMIMLFFPFHYGMFWLVHGVFVFVFFGLGFMPGAAFTGLSGISGINVSGVLLAASVMVISQLMSLLFVFYAQGEYQRISPDQQMRQPYSRVYVLHGVIIGGAFLINQFGTPMAALALLVVLKLTADLVLTFREGSRQPTGAPDASPASFSKP
jgi:hypothetical protein